MNWKIREVKITLLRLFEENSIDFLRLVKDPLYDIWYLTGESMLWIDRDYVPNDDNGIPVYNNNMGSTIDLKRRFKDNIASLFKPSGTEIEIYKTQKKVIEAHKKTIIFGMHKYQEQSLMLNNKIVSFNTIFEVSERSIVRSDDDMIIVIST